MNTTTAKLNRSQAAEPSAQLLQLESTMKRQLFIRLNRDLIPKIKQGHFAQPSFPSGGLKKRPLSSISTDDCSTQDGLSEASLSLKTVRIAGSDKKFKALYSMLNSFEEEAIADRALKGKTLREMRFFTRKYFGMVMNNQDLVKLQHSDTLGLAILLHAGIKVGLGKSEFLTQAAKVARRKNLSISYIRKTKCYGILKQLIKAEKRADLKM
jgi:hypothetical protein